MTQLKLVLALVLAFVSVAVSGSSALRGSDETCDKEARQLLALESNTVCFSSPESALVIADEAGPVRNPNIPGWQYTREAQPTTCTTTLANRCQINWYFGANPAFPYSELQSMYAVITFSDFPSYEGPYFTLYTGPAASPPPFYITNLQWRFPGPTMLTGKVLIWAGPTEPAADVHPEIASRFRLGVPPTGVASLSFGAALNTADNVFLMAIATDSNSPLQNPIDFTVESVGFINSAGATQKVLTFCTDAPTAAPTKPTPLPTAKPKPTPLPTAKPTSKPTKKM